MVTDLSALQEGRIGTGEFSQTRHESGGKSSSCLDHTLAYSGVNPGDACVEKGSNLRLTVAQSFDQFFNKWPDALIPTHLIFDPINDIANCDVLFIPTTSPAGPFLCFG